MRKVTLFIMVMLALSISFWAEATSFTAEAEDNSWYRGGVSGKIWSVETDDGRTVLHIKDDLGYGGGGVHWLYRPWDVVPSEWYNTATFVLKSVSTLGGLGIYFAIGTSDGAGNDYNMFYGIYPDRVEAVFTTGTPFYSFDTTSGYNAYTAMLHEGVATLWINGKFAFSTPARTGLQNGVNGVQFGDGTSFETGEAYWDYVSANQVIPEPTTIILLSSGIVCLLGLYVRSRRKRQ